MNQLIQDANKEQTEENLSIVAKRLPFNNKIHVVNGKVIFSPKDIIKALGVDYIGE